MWSEESSKRLKELWPAYPVRDIAEMMGVSKNAVIGRAHRLSLPNKSAEKIPGSDALLACLLADRWQWPLESIAQALWIEESKAKAYAKKGREIVEKNGYRDAADAPALASWTRHHEDRENLGCSGASGL